MGVGGMHGLRRSANPKSTTSGTQFENPRCNYLVVAYLLTREIALNTFGQNKNRKESLQKENQVFTDVSFRALQGSSIEKEPCFTPQTRAKRI